MLRISEFGYHDSLGTLNSFINHLNGSVMSVLFPFLCVFKRKGHCCTALLHVTKYIPFKAGGRQCGAILIFWNIR